jgi:hypothetical protein
MTMSVEVPRIVPGSVSYGTVLVKVSMSRVRFVEAVDSNVNVNTGELVIVKPNMLVWKDAVKIVVAV